MRIARWFVVFAHDGSPVDGGCFIHKSAAIKHKDALKGADKMKVVKMEVSNV